jgi:hypothetical protein
LSLINVIARRIFNCRFPHKRYVNNKHPYPQGKKSLGLLFLTYQICSDFNKNSKNLPTTDFLQKGITKKNLSNLVQLLAIYKKSHF